MILFDSKICRFQLLARTRISRTAEYSSAFDFVSQSNPKFCPHFYAQNLFLFDLTSVIDYLRKTQHENLSNLIGLFDEQIEASKRNDFWKTIEVRRTFSSSLDGRFRFRLGSMRISTDDRPDRSESKRRQTLRKFTRTSVSFSFSFSFSFSNETSKFFSRRNLLADIFRTSQVDQSMTELETIENELRQLIQRMHLAAPDETTKHVEQTKSVRTDKLKDLMQRCKTLINTILTFDDYVSVGDDVVEYIQRNLPYLNSDKRSSNEEQLFVEYSKLLENLTAIVNDLRQRVPLGVDVA